MHEVAEPVVVIALPREQGPEPVEEWDSRIGVMTTDAKDAHVERDEDVAKRGKTKSPVSPDEDRESGQGGGNLEPPGKAIIRTPALPKKNGDDRSQ